MKATLISALKAAGQIQKQNFRKPVEAVQKESVSSVVTETDFRSERAIMDLISKDCPDHNILSEESGFHDNGSIFTWVIDPLDGTSNFAAGVPWFGVLVALFRGQNPLMAGAYLPLEDKLFFAEQGKGAFANDVRLDLPSFLLKDSLFAFSTDFTEDPNYLQKSLLIYQYLVQNTRNVRTTNSLVDMLFVAEGKFGGCINMYNRIWDIAAPYLIIKESGGCVNQLSGGELIFELNRAGVDKNYPVVIGSKVICEKLNRFLDDLSVA